MGRGCIVEVGVIAFPITMEQLFLHLIRIMMKTVKTVLNFTQQLGGTNPVTFQILMGLTMALESQLHLVLELVGEVLMDFMILCNPM